MRSLGFRITLAAVALVALKVHLPQLVDPWRFNGDERQHVFWTYRYADPELFPGDPLVRFISGPRFDPPGYAAVYAVGARLMDALQFSKVLSLLLAFPVGFFAFRIGRRLGGDVTGFLAAVAIAFTVCDDARGGLPRSFAFPVVLAFLDALVHRSRVGAGASFVAAALFYPPLVPSMGVLLPLFFLDGWKFRLGTFRSIVPCALLLVVALAIVAASYFLADSQFVGPMVTREEAFAMPEFHEKGRNEFFVDDPVRYWLGDWSYNRSACNLFSKNVMAPLVAAVLSLALALLLRRRPILPRELAWTLASSAVLFVVAHLVLFKLFQPSRYTMFTWPVTLVLVAAVNVGPLLERPFNAVAARLRGRVGTLVFVLALVALTTTLMVRLVRRPPSADDLGLFSSVSMLPKNVVIAGFPESLDNIPLRTRRSVFINRELSLPYYKNYYALVKHRIETSLEMVFSRSAQALREAMTREGVTHLLVDKRKVQDALESVPGVVDPPYDRLLASLCGDAAVPIVLTRFHGLRVLHEDAKNLLLER